jgi:hypothetical protein
MYPIHLPFDNDESDYSSDNLDIYIAGKNLKYNVTGEGITGNINATNTTKKANKITTNQPEPKNNPPEASPLKANIAGKNLDDNTVLDAGNSRATSHSSTPKNATTIISKTFIDIQIKLEPIKQPNRLTLSMHVSTDAKLGYQRSGKFNLLSNFTLLTQ